MATKKDGKVERAKRYNTGMRHEIMKLLLSLGTVTTNGLRMKFRDNYKYAAETMRRMMDEGIIREGKYVLGRRVTRYFVLNDFPTKKKIYMRYFPVGYYYCYHTYGENNAKDISRRQKEEVYTMERIARISDIGVMMMRSGVKSMPDEIHEILKGDAKIEEGGTYYFTANAVKRSLDVVSNSRAVGFMCCTNETFVVYNTGERARLKWSVSTEGKIMRIVNMIDREMREVKIENGREVSAILIGGEQAVSMIFEEREDKRVSTIKIPSGYKEMLYVPYTEDGVWLLEQMNTAEWRAELKKKYLKGLEPPNIKNGIAHDAKDKDVNVLLFCIPDIEKLHNFVTHAKFTGAKEKFRILCYPFQEGFLRTITGDNCEIQTIMNE